MPVKYLLASFILFNFYYSTSIASTGQLSAASFASSWQSSGTSDFIAWAYPSSVSSKTSGHIDGHNPHPIQVSLSTLAFLS